MNVIVIGLAAVCFLLFGIGFLLYHIGETLEYIARNMKKGGTE